MPMQMGFRWYGEGNDKIKCACYVMDKLIPQNSVIINEVMFDSITKKNDTIAVSLEDSKLSGAVSSAYAAHCDENGNGMKIFPNIQ